MDMQGRAVLLTGADDGIGFAAARRFAREGASVAVTGRRAEKVRSAAEALSALCAAPARALGVAGDVSVPADVERMVAEAVAAFGRLDVLVNCAALQAGGTVLDATPEDWTRMFAVNVMGYGLCAKAALPHLLRSPMAAVVNVASLNGNVGTASRTVYNASKAAVIEMTMSMACDFPTVRVNCVSPGFTASDAMMHGMGMTGLPAEEAARLLSAGVMMKRFAAPDEIASVIHFLASDEASYMTGSNVLVDGGALCRGNYGDALESELARRAGKGV